MNAFQSIQNDSEFCQAYPKFPFFNVIVFHNSSFVVLRYYVDEIVSLSAL